MGEPRVPGADDGAVELPCGRGVPPNTFDLGMREYPCTCGSRHAVVMDVHPLGRWIPESVVGVLEETIEPTDEYATFGTIHLMGMVLEEFPDAVTVHDSSQDPGVGWALLWVADFDARRLHTVIVELLVELMDHAIGHAEDPTIHGTFDEQLAGFDVDAFVDAYRAARDFEDGRDVPV